MTTITWNDFEKIEMRVGVIAAVQPFPAARKPSYRIEVDLGEDIGVKKSCAQLTNYAPEELVGKQVICVVNFPPKQIATALSEVLILGMPGGEQGTSILTSDFRVPLGGRVF